MGVDICHQTKPGDKSTSDKWFDQQLTWVQTQPLGGQFDSSEEQDSKPSQTFSCDNKIVAVGQYERFIHVCAVFIVSSIQFGIDPLIYRANM